MKLEHKARSINLKSNLKPPTRYTLLFHFSSTQIKCQWPTRSQLEFLMRINDRRKPGPNSEHCQAVRALLRWILVVGLVFSDAIALTSFSWWTTRIIFRWVWSEKIDDSGKLFAEKSSLSYCFSPLFSLFFFHLPLSDSHSILSHPISLSVCVLLWVYYSVCVVWILVAPLSAMWVCMYIVHGRWIFLSLGIIVSYME